MPKAKPSVRRRAGKGARPASTQSNLPRIFSAPFDEYGRNVFINCPFDAAYQPVMEAAVFTIRFLGYIPRSAKESKDAGDIRIEKIKRLISECKFGLHDISRVELSENNLPRFNMPFELGMDISCAEFGSERHKEKRILILDTEEFRYQKFLSDISGQDISIYDGSEQGVIRAIRDWLRTNNDQIPGADFIFERYSDFQAALPLLRSKWKLDRTGQLSFTDYSLTAQYWLEERV